MLVMVNFLGLMVENIMVRIKMIKSMGMVNFNGLMAEFTKETGKKKKKNFFFFFCLINLGKMVNRMEGFFFLIKNIKKKNLFKLRGIYIGS